MVGTTSSRNSRSSVERAILARSFALARENRPRKRETTDGGGGSLGSLSSSLKKSKAGAEGAAGVTATGATIGADVTEGEGITDTVEGLAGAGSGTTWLSILGRGDSVPAFTDFEGDGGCRSEGEAALLVLREKKERMPPVAAGFLIWVSVVICCSFGTIFHPAGAASVDDKSAVVLTAVSQEVDPFDSRYIAMGPFLEMMLFFDSFSASASCFAIKVCLNGFCISSDKPSGTSMSRTEPLGTISREVDAQETRNLRDDVFQVDWS